MQETRDKASGDDAPEFDQSRITVAEILRTGREKRGQDLRSVANVLRIRYVFLEAIERGDFASLPGDTYAYGFVRTYAGYLSLDKDEIVRQFKEEVESYGARKTLVFPTPVPESKTPGLAILLTSILLLALAYGGWTAVSRFDIELPDWVPFISDSKSGDAAETSDATPSEVNVVEETSSGEVSEITNQQNNSTEITDITDVLPPAVEQPEEVVTEVEQAAAVISENVDNVTNEVSSDTETASVEVPAEPVSEPAEPVMAADSSLSGSGESSSETTVDAAEVSEEIPSDAENEVAAVITPPPPPEPEVFGDEGVASAISILAEQDSWVHIVDPSGEAIFSRVLRAGSVYNVPKREGLIMTTGNAGGIILKINGQDLPKIGPIGDVKRNIVLSEDGLLPSIQSE
ncbi:RodZ domain-containing protein [Kiloniella sp.]|uniref:RodZ domain-containing protein n=1 Tax=Kiloniella sp. TaxID=1938587 RepID=UPI003B019B62